MGLLAASILVGGCYAIRNTWQSLRERVLQIDMLMFVAAAGAAALGQLAESAPLRALFSPAHAPEHLAIDRSRHVMEALANVARKAALVLRDGAELEMPVDKVADSLVFAGTVNGECLLRVDVSAGQGPLAGPRGHRSAHSHESATVLVVFNALRLLRLVDRADPQL